MGVWFDESNGLCPFLGEECARSACALYYVDECRLSSMEYVAGFYAEEIDERMAYIADVLLAIADKMGADLSGVENPEDKLVIVRRDGGEQDGPDAAVAAHVITDEHGVIAFRVGLGPIPISEFEAWWNSPSPRGEI